MMYALQKMRREKPMANGGFSVLWREGEFGVKFLGLNFAGILAFWRENLVKFSENLHGFCDFVLFLGEFGRKFMAKIFALSRFAKNGKFVGFCVNSLKFSQKFAEFTRNYGKEREFIVGFFAPLRFAQNDKFMGFYANSNQIYTNLQKFNSKFRLVDCFVSAVALPRTQRVAKQNYGVEREFSANSLTFSQKFAKFTRNSSKEKVAK